MELLAHRLVPHRVAIEPCAVQQIITCCARLPLALSIAAARAQQSEFPLATRDTQHRADGAQVRAPCRRQL